MVFRICFLSGLGQRTLYHGLFSLDFATQSPILLSFSIFVLKLLSAEQHSDTLAVLPKKRKTQVWSLYYCLQKILPKSLSNMNRSSISYKFYFYLIFATLIFPAACSVSPEKPFPVPMLSPIQELTSELKASPLVAGRTYAVKESIDGRSDKNLFTYEGEKFGVDADLAPVVREAMEIALSKQGFQFSPKGPAVLRLEIMKWSVSINEGLLNEGNAVSELQVEIFTPKMVRTYRGVYQGTSEVSSFTLDNEKIKHVLALSMSHAISQAVEDKGLLTAISSVR